MGSGGGTGGGGERIWLRAREMWFLTCTGPAGPEQIPMDCRDLKKSAEKDLQPFFTPPPKTELHEQLRLWRPTAPTSPPPQGTTWKLLDPERSEVFAFHLSVARPAIQSRHTPFMTSLQLFDSYFCICLMADWVVCDCSAGLGDRCSCSSQGIDFSLPSPATSHTLLLPAPQLFFSYLYPLLF